MSAIENLSVTTMRNIIGDMDLEQPLTSRDTINSQKRALLAAAKVAQALEQVDYVEDPHLGKGTCCVVGINADEIEIIMEERGR